MNPYVLLMRLIAYLLLVSYMAGLLISAAMVRDYVSMAVICVIGALFTANRTAIVGIKAK
jgi:hypothetical protein